MLLIPGFGGATIGHSVGLTFAPALIEAQLVTGVWSNLTPDVLLSEGVRWSYGIDGNGPTDCLAGTGTLSFGLRNDNANSGSTQGWYSPVHVSKRSGWTFGVPIRVIVTSGPQLAVTSITRSGTVATLTTPAPHGLTTGDTALVMGAAEAEYNGMVTATVTGGSTFEYAVIGTPATPATGTITWARAYIKFRGKVREIRPEAGREKSKRVYVVAHDHMRDLHETSARELTLQVDQREDALVHAILSSIPSSAQPVARSIDSGVDVFPYAFDDVGGGVTAGALMRDVILSSYGLGFIRGDGTFVYKNRHTRGTGTSVATFNNTMIDLEVPTSLDGVYNHVRATIHPKTIDENPDVVLYEMTGTPPLIGAGSTSTFWGEYRDPTNVTRLIGGLDVVTPLVAQTDYRANEAQDGLGVDYTDSVTIVTTAFASTAKFEVTNTAAFPVYLTLMQLRGKGVYDDGPQTFEEQSAQSYGDRPVDVDMPYQDNQFIGQSAATFIEAQYSMLENQVTGMLIAGSTSALLTQALAREPGDVITTTEDMTGLTAVDTVIVRAEYELVQGSTLFCRWGLAPASPFTQWWELGVAGNSELGDTTQLGF